jgi:hypothetical protein
MQLFSAEKITGEVDSDRSLLPYSLWNLPFLINYREPEGPFDSKLNILFDRTAEGKITVEFFYTLGRGLVEMFRQLIMRHGRDGKFF